MSKKSFFKNPIVKKILWVLAVTVGGFILWNLTFMFVALFQGIIRRLFMLFIQMDPEQGYGWFPGLMHGLSFIVICLISWPIFKSKLGTLYKAICSTVPLAVVFVTIGMSLNHWPVLGYSLGGLFCIGVLYYLYRTKQSWIYYYAVIFTGLTLAIFTLMGGEI
jgi:hypothetical protein